MHWGKIKSCKQIFISFNKTKQINSRKRLSQKAIQYFNENCMKIQCDENILAIDVT